MFSRRGWRRRRRRRSSRASSVVAMMMMMMMTTRASLVALAFGVSRLTHRTSSDAPRGHRVVPESTPRRRFLRHGIAKVTTNLWRFPSRTRLPLARRKPFAKRKRVDVALSSSVCSFLSSTLVLELSGERTALLSFIAQSIPKQQRRGDDEERGDDARQADRDEIHPDGNAHLAPRGAQAHEIVGRERG